MQPAAAFYILGALLACTNSVASKKVVCYFSSWAVYREGNGNFDISNIDPNLCTHLVYSYAGLEYVGTVKSLDTWADLPNGKDGYRRFNQLRLRNPGVKTFLAVGGWSQASATFSSVAANSYSRARFVNSALNFVQKYDFNGLSLDWQYPNQRGGNVADKQNYVLLLKELRSSFDRVGLQLMVTVGAVHLSASLSYNIPEMSQYVDTINLMTYDFHGSWESTTGINSPVYPAQNEYGDNRLLNVHETIKYWLNHGAPAGKLVVGIPAYGRSFTLASTYNNGIGAPSSGAGNPGPYTKQAGFLGHNEIEELYSRFFTKHYDVERKAWYAYRGNQWYSFEDQSTIDAKAKLINDYGLGGAMLYSIDTDDFRGYSGSTYTLLRKVNRALNNYNPSSPPGEVDWCDLVCREEGYLRHPYQCNVFYYCQSYNGGKTFVRRDFTCPANLYFDLIKESCEWPNLVNCYGCKYPFLMNKTKNDL